MLPTNLQSSDAANDLDVITSDVSGLHHMMAANDHQQKRVTSNIQAYTQLVTSLDALTRKRDVEVMVPVADGLGYFQGVVRRTDEVMLLLGDSWFVKGSVYYAMGVAGRRIEYLKKEAQSLSEERDGLVAKEKVILMSNDMEGGPKRKASDKVSKSRGVRFQIDSHTSNVVKPHPTDKAPNDSNTGVIDNMASTGDTGDDYGMDPYDANDYGIDEEEDRYPVIAPEDELTLEELIAIEEALGSDVNDEVLAEQAILKAVADKKRARLAATEAAGLVSSTGAVMQDSKPTAVSHAPLVCDSKPRDSPIAIHTPVTPSDTSNAQILTPGDIGREFIPHTMPSICTSDVKPSSTLLDVVERPVSECGNNNNNNRNNNSIPKKRSLFGLQHGLK